MIQADPRRYWQLYQRHMESGASLPSGYERLLNCHRIIRRQKHKADLRHEAHSLRLSVVTFVPRLNLLGGVALECRLSVCPEFCQPLKAC